MRNYQLSDEQWAKIRQYLAEHESVYSGNEARTRQFLNALVWLARGGTAWRMLPHEYGKWNSVYKRFARWEEQGVWERMLAHFVVEPDMESVMIDSTILRAHPAAAGAPAEKGGSRPRRWDVVGAALAASSILPLMPWAIPSVSC